MSLYPPVKPGENIPAGDVGPRAGLEFAELAALTFVANMLPRGPWQYMEPSKEEL